MDYTSWFSSHFPSFLLGRDSYTDIELSQKQSSDSQEQPSLLSEAGTQTSLTLLLAQGGWGGQHQEAVCEQKKASKSTREQTDRQTDTCRSAVSPDTAELLAKLPWHPPLLWHCLPPVYDKGQPRPSITSQKRYDARDYSRCTRIKILQTDELLSTHCLFPMHSYRICMPSLTPSCSKIPTITEKKIQAIHAGH